MFTLNKNIARIEQYNLDELAQEVNYISHDKSNSHCVYRLALGERGLKVTSLLFNVTELKKMMILTQRGRKDIWYILHWAKLMMNHQHDVQEFMRAQAELLDVSISGDHKPHWVSKMQVTWGYDVNKVGLYIELERKVESVAAVVVPTCLLQVPTAMFQLLTRQQLLDAGILTIADLHMGQAEIKRPGCGSCCVQDNQACNGDECDDDVVVVNSVDASAVKPAWYTSLYQGVVGKLASMQSYMCQKIGIFC